MATGWVGEAASATERDVDHLPGVDAVSVEPFTACISSTLIPCWRAISQRESPDWIV
jgi:hypothetical protein